MRTLTEAERQQRRAGLRAQDAFTRRRCQLLLARAAGPSPPQSARTWGCTAPSVRNARHAFHTQGLACLKPKSWRPRTAPPLLHDICHESLLALRPQSPRAACGKRRRTWTWDLLAEVLAEKGWTPRRLSREGSRRARRRLPISWQRAQHWITSPDPADARKQYARARLLRLAASPPDWVLGFQDATWWSRLARPELHAGAEAERPLRLLQGATSKEDPDPKALGCYGRLRYDADALMLRFVDGRPVSQVTEDYLAWVCAARAREGQRALLVVWDNASGHVSRRVRAWLKAHNRRVKREGGVRLIGCRLPSKSPWLNPLEPKWLPGNKAIVEPDRLLPAVEVETRVCESYGCAQEVHLHQVVPVKTKASSRKKVA